MKVHFKFTDKNGKIQGWKQLGCFWQQDKDFIIEINIDQSEKEKLVTFIEEFLHFSIRWISNVRKSEITKIKEEILIKKIIRMLRKEEII